MKFKIDLKFVLFLLLFYFSKQLYIYLIIMFFCCIHEIAHILVAKILEFKIKYIELHPFGFCCEIKPKIGDYNIRFANSNIVELKKIIIAIAGPLTNTILILILNTIFSYLENINLMIYSNLVIILFNILPIIPLDGGRIFKSFFRILKGNIVANKIMYFVSNLVIVFLTVVSSLAILYWQNISILLILFYLWYLVILENKRFYMKNQIYKRIQA